MRSRLILAAVVAAAAAPVAAQDDLSALLGTWSYANCDGSDIRLRTDFDAHTVSCRGGRIGGSAVRGEGSGFILQLEVTGPVWYQPVKSYFADARMFESTSDWGDEQDAERRFDYATFRADLKDDDKGVLSCVGITRHSSPYEGRGAIAKNLIVGIYCDENFGDGPVPEARINQVIAAIEFEFE